MLLLDKIYAVEAEAVSAEEFLQRQDLRKSDR